MIGIIGAMEEEVQAILTTMNIEETKVELDYKFYVGKIENVAVVVMQSGIGKVNAAISTTLLLKKYQPTHVINIGTAGGLSIEQKQGDVVVSTKVIHHDVDATGFSYDIGQVPRMPSYFKADTLLLTQVIEVLEQIKIKHHVGIIASGDQFISREEQVSYILNSFEDVLCADMEAASIAQVCYVFKIPFIVIRSLSDVFGKGNHHLQFNEYILLASKNSAIITKQLIKTLQGRRL